MIQVKLTKQAKQLGEELEVSFMPTRHTEGSNGYDLRACIEEDIILAPKEEYRFPTGVRIHLSSELPYPAIDQETIFDCDDTFPIKPAGLLHWANAFPLKPAGLLLPRSSMRLTLTNSVGLIDSDYQGEILFSYRNDKDIFIKIKPGQRIGQLVLVATLCFDLPLVKEFNKTTKRGEGGFGHTGEH